MDEKCFLGFLLDFIIPKAAQTNSVEFA